MWAVRGARPLTLPLRVCGTGVHPRPVVCRERHGERVRYPSGILSLDVLRHAELAWDPFLVPFAPKDVISSETAWCAPSSLLDVPSRHGVAGLQLIGVVAATRGRRFLAAFATADFSGVGVPSSGFACGDDCELNGDPFREHVPVGGSCDSPRLPVLAWPMGVGHLWRRGECVR